VADVLDYCDALAGAIPGAERVYEVDLNVEDMTGRRVLVMPAAYGFPGPADRGVDLSEFRAVVVVAERYTGAGSPPVEWVDERVRWVSDNVVALDDARAPDVIPGLFAWESEVNPVYDVEELVRRKLFLSAVFLTARQV
jgi:hypothetical protein